MTVPEHLKHWTELEWLASSLMCSSSLHDENILEWIEEATKRIRALEEAAGITGTK